MDFIESISWLVPLTCFIIAAICFLIVLFKGEVEETLTGIVVCIMFLFLLPAFLITLAKLSNHGDWIPVTSTRIELACYPSKVQNVAKKYAGGSDVWVTCEDGSVHGVEAGWEK